MYVGMDSHMLRVEKDNNAKEKKEEKSEMEAKMRQENKNVFRKLEDGLLLVVPAKIYGKPVKAPIDSAATRCFLTPSCVTTIGLKGIP